VKQSLATAPDFFTPSARPRFLTAEPGRG
jgi:hypothetical protein